MTISYSQLTSWRNLCEFLDKLWYKFATCEEISAHCSCLPGLYRMRREHRSLLWEKYLIQFCTYQQHPILTFSHSRSTKREFKDVWGWRLMKDWEFKIDYLEQIVLFNREPEIKPWESDLRARLLERKRRRDAVELRDKLLAMKESERRVQCRNLNICWNCQQALVFMMIDCVKCGQAQ
ncbi:MAG: hypothetical protein AB1861_08455 [Cyanobacteriota bacterium]